VSARARRLGPIFAAVVLSWAPVAGAQQWALTTDNPAMSYVRDAGPHQRPVDLSAIVGTPGALLVGFGGGLRVSFPLVHDGFIGSINNAVRLETGAEFYHWSYASFDYDTVAIPLQLRWDFYVAEQWTVFVAAGLAVNLYYFGDGAGFFDAPEHTDLWGFGSGALITTAVGFGALLNFSESVSLRFDASLNLLGLGLTFRL
jgi:hypothetical protein